MCVAQILPKLQGSQLLENLGFESATSNVLRDLVAKPSMKAIQEKESLILRSEQASTAMRPATSYALVKAIIPLFIYTGAFVLLFPNSLINFPSRTWREELASRSNIFVTKEGTSPFNSYRNRTLLWVRPRTGGFNNQLITLHKAIECAISQNYTLVVPHLFDNVRYDTSFDGEGPYPFSDYFDVERLSKLVPVVTPDATSWNLGLRTRHTLRVFFENAIARRPVCRIKTRDASVGKSGTNLFQIYGKEYGVKVEKVHDPLQKGICIDQTLCPARGSLERSGYSHYGETGQGFSVKRSRIMKDIACHLQPSELVREISESFLTIGQEFNAMHIRRGDYHSKCEQMKLFCELYGVEAFIQNETTIVNTLARFRRNDLPVFISTTHGVEVKNILRSKGIRIKIWLLEDFEVPRKFGRYVNRTDVLSLASQILATHAHEFIGNRFSSFSAEINNRRLA